MTDGSHLARAEEIGQGAQSLLDIGARIGVVVDLVEVDVVDAKTAQGRFDSGDDPAARIAAPVGVWPHRAAELGGEDDVVAAAAQCLPDDLLGFAVAAVYVGGVDEVDPVVERTVDDAHALVVVGVAETPELHGAQGVRADVNAGAAEWAGAHGVSPVSSVAPDGGPLGATGVRPHPGQCGGSGRGVLGRDVEDPGDAEAIAQHPEGGRPLRRAEFLDDRRTVREAFP